MSVDVLCLRFARLSYLRIVAVIALWKEQEDKRQAEGETPSENGKNTATEVSGRKQSDYGSGGDCRFIIFGAFWLE